MNLSTVYNRMRRNLPSFDEWMEAKDVPEKEESKDKPEDEPKGMTFDQWLKQNMNMKIQDFADISDIVMANKSLKPIGDDDPIGLKKLTIYKLTKDPDTGTVRLKIKAKSDPNDPEMAEFPYASASPHDGDEFTLSQDEYEKLLKFPPKPAGGVPGAPGGLGGLGL